jgi:hypothetical protein
MRSAIVVLCLLVAGVASAADLTVEWTFATNNVDGTALVDLAGAKIYYGTSSSNYTEVVDVPGGEPGQRCTFTITGLVAKTTYFVNGTAYNDEGLESDLCDEVSRRVTTRPGKNKNLVLILR